MIRAAVICNEVVRFAVKSALPVLNWYFAARMASRAAQFSRRQKRLRLQYRITDTTPIREYDVETEKHIQAFSSRHRDVRLATTSGTTGRPKKIAYTKKRLRQYKADSRACGIQCFHHFKVKRPTIFILANLTCDDSFSSYVLDNGGRRPGYFTGLIEPGRYLTQATMLQIVQVYGATAARLWLLAVSNPGVLYATNPSTIATFFAELHQHWRQSSALVRDYYKTPARFKNLTTILRRVAAAGYMHRIKIIAEANAPCASEDFLPRLSAWCSWDGGYVLPYIRQVENYLAPDRIPHIPMYSMSTEVVQTLTCFDQNGEICFLPLAPHVLYEFLPEYAPQTPENLLTAGDLQPGGIYSMVVSDSYGLVRYQTNDLFECHRLLGKLPDLRFLRRRGLAFSFTGEKLTGGQLTEAYARLRRAMPAVGKTGVQLCCFPSCESEHQLPAYQLVLVLGPGGEQTTFAEIEIAQEFEKILATLNHEFDAKRRTGRLGMTKVTAVPYQCFAIALDVRTRTQEDVSRRAWESQFKLAPLYPVLWEEVQNKLGKAAA